jgi:hypothetical protein
MCALADDRKVDLVITDLGSRRSTSPPREIFTGERRT